MRLTEAEKERGAVLRGSAPLKFNRRKTMEIEVELTKNGHILYDGNLIAILGQWNRFEDLVDIDCDIEAQTIGVEV